MKPFRCCWALNCSPLHASFLSSGAFQCVALGVPQSPPQDSHSRFLPWASTIRSPFNPGFHLGSLAPPLCSPVSGSPWQALQPSNRCLASVLCRPSPETFLSGYCLLSETFEDPFPYVFAFPFSFPFDSPLNPLICHLLLALLILVPDAVHFLKCCFIFPEPRR